MERAKLAKRDSCPGQRSDFISLGCSGAVSVNLQCDPGSDFARDEGLGLSLLQKLWDAWIWEILLWAHF